MQANCFELNFFIKNFSPDGQTRWVKSFSQPVDLPDALLLMKPLVQLGLICSIEFNWLGNQTHIKLGVQFHLSAETHNCKMTKWHYG